MINSPDLISKPDRQRMTAAGLTQEILDGILDERFVEIFRTRALRFWVQDTLDVNYRALCLARPEDKEDEARRASKAAKTAEGVSAGECSRLYCESAESAQSPIVPPTLTLARAGSASSMPPSLLQRCVLRPDTPPALPNHTALYKACAVPVLLDCWPNFVEEEDSSVNFSALANGRVDDGGDFHSGYLATYWVPDAGVAEYHRQYAAARCRRAATCVVRILVPDAYLASVKVVRLVDERRWKEYVWHCRRWRVGAPEGFEELHHADVVVGNICTVEDERLRCGRLEDVHSDIGAGDVLRSEDGQRAVQWCFKDGRGSGPLLETAVQGKVHLDVFENENLAW